MPRLVFREPRTPHSLRLRIGNMRCYASHISFIIPLPYKIGKNGNVNFNFLRGRLTNEQTSISLLRIHRMVSGNTLDGTSFPASGRCCHERHHIPSYVPHLRLCISDPAGLSENKKLSSSAAGILIYCRFLCGRIHQRLYFASLSHVSLGLLPCSPSIPGNHPS